MADTTRSPARRTSGKAAPAPARGTKAAGAARPPRGSGKKPATKTWTAASADRHLLYQAAVQSVEPEIDFVDRIFKKLRGRPATRLREDFCGTGNTSCEWVRRRKENVAVGLDIDGPTLEWGRRHNVGVLKADQQDRVHLLERNVLEPGDAVRMDCVLAMNFSYWILQERATLKRYFQSVLASLADGGLLFCDFYGGSEAMTVCTEKRKCVLEGHGKFTYVWDQARYNPITGDMQCYIHFEFPDGSEKRRAFSYRWRLWTLPEIVDLLKESGFSNVTVYWEGDEVDAKGEKTGEGNGVFRPATNGEPCPAFICYIVCEK